MKRESARFHSTWVKETMPAAEGVAGQADEVPVAVEVMAGMLWQLCLARHQNKGHAKTSKAMLWEQGQGWRHAPYFKGEDGHLHQNKIW